MNKEFIPYEQALALKELGFDEPCFAGYSTSTEQIEFYSRPLLTRDSFTIDAPTYSQAFRFFREKFNLLGYVSEATITKGKVYMFCCNKGNDTLFEDIDSDFNTYEEAELACLIKLIEICKNK